MASSTSSNSDSGVHNGSNAMAGSIPAGGHTTTRCHTAHIRPSRRRRQTRFRYKTRSGPNDSSSSNTAPDGSIGNPSTLGRRGDKIPDHAVVWMGRNAQVPDAADRSNSIPAHASRTDRGPCIDRHRQPDLASDPFRDDSVCPVQDRFRPACQVCHPSPIRDVRLTTDSDPDPESRDAAHSVVRQDVRHQPRRGAVESVPCHRLLHPEASDESTGCPNPDPEASDESTGVKPTSWWKVGSERFPRRRRSRVGTMVVRQTSPMVRSPGDSTPQATKNRSTDAAASPMVHSPGDSTPQISPGWHHFRKVHVYSEPKPLRRSRKRSLHRGAGKRKNQSFSWFISFQDHGATRPPRTRSSVTPDPKRPCSGTDETLRRFPIAVHYHCNTTIIMMVKKRNCEPKKYLFRFFAEFSPGNMGDFSIGYGNEAGLAQNTQLWQNE